MIMQVASDNYSDIGPIRELFDDVRHWVEMLATRSGARGWLEFLH